MTSRILYIPEQQVSGRRLGRHIEHDPRSMAYPVPTGCLPSILGMTKARTIRWKRSAPIFDQGDLGSCTGNAMAGVIGTGSAHAEGNPAADEDLAVRLYELATQLDDIDGTYPPDDTGSSGLGVAKAAKRLGLIRGYRHAFSWRGFLAAISMGPVITGISWRTGCDDPDANGLVSYTGSVRGGHEIEVVGIDAAKQLVWFANSWGEGWGLNGYFCMSFVDYRTALAQGGDITVPVI